MHFEHAEAETTLEIENIEEDDSQLEAPLFVKLKKWVVMSLAHVDQVRNINNAMESYKGHEFININFIIFTFNR